MALVRSSLIALSHNRSLRRFLENSRTGARLSSRFVAGMTQEDALRVAKTVNDQGISVTIDSLGESGTTEKEAFRAAEIYHLLLDSIATNKLDANISIKLTQMGLNLSPQLAQTITGNLAQHAATTGNFVRVDMEESSLTQVTLDIVRRIHARSDVRDAIGVVIQAYLYRSQSDIEQLLAEEIRVRLCKGAYREPHTIAFPHKADVDQNFVVLTKLLLSSRLHHAIATHDESMIDAAIDFVENRGIDRQTFEFQMLYGVRRDLQRYLVKKGYRVRVYVPFGTDWYPYFMRRLAERPANIIFLARNFFR